MRQQQKFRGWIDNTWSKCRYSEQREISISLNYSSDRFHERFREVMKYAVRWSMMDRFSIPDLWAVSGVSLLSEERSRLSLILTSQSQESWLEAKVRKTPYHHYRDGQPPGLPLPLHDQLAGHPPGDPAVRVGPPQHLRHLRPHRARPRPSPRPANPGTRGLHRR